MTDADSAVLLPLTEAQRGVWVAQHIDPASPRFNCGGYLDISGDVDPGVLENAIRRVLEETEALRVSFSGGESNPTQVVKPCPAAVLEFDDLHMHSGAETAAVAKMTEDLAQPHSLVSGALHRHILFKIADRRYFFYLRFHHILMDGYSQTIYWRRIGDLYTTMVSNQEIRPALARPLAELVSTEQAYLSSSELQSDRQAWLDSLHDLSQPVRLAASRARTSRGRLRRNVVLPLATAEKLRALAHQLGARWSVLMIAAVAAYTRQLDATDDVLLALPVSGRISASLAATPAMLANELPLRIRVDRSSSFSSLVGEVTRAVAFVLAHQRYRGEALQRDLSGVIQDSRLGTPVVNIISFDQQVRFGGSTTTPHYLSSGPVNDLLIGCYGRSDGSDIQLFFDANPDSYTPDDLTAHQERFLHLLAAILGNESDKPLSAIDTQLPAEQAQLNEWNATARPYDLTNCLHQLIDAQAARTPDRIAVAVNDSQLTFAELVERADRLASRLIERGVARGQRVAVLDVRSLEMVISLLAVLKAGAAYLPLDPELPAERLAFQLQDAEIRLVLTRSVFEIQLSGLGADMIPVDRELPTIGPLSHPLPLLGRPEDAAYVIYTSGSTGRPKGVAVPHRGVVNRLLWMQEQYQLGSDDCVLQKTAYTFDVSVWEFFWPLIAGSRLFLAEPGAHRDPRRIAELVRQQGITTIHFVPPMLDLFLEEQVAGTTDTPLRRVICSGEALRSETVAAFFRAFPQSSGTGLYNLYGPTEASIDVTHWTCTPADSEGPIPIGRPVANTQIHILDECGKPVPNGVAGELYIGGVQVALGYLNRPELNATSFIPDPFREGALYRTGDLARYRRDGAIEFLGRKDQQIKIRGFRIEPGEIESALMTHSKVRQAVVHAWQVTSGERRLVAYVVASEGPAPRDQELVAYLTELLPEYMVPQHVVLLDALPLSRNGKVDRSALPALRLADGGTSATLDTAQERLLATIWSELLGKEVTDPDQSFFSLGGDSMLAIRMRSQTERQGYTFEVQDVFRHPSLRELAARLRRYETADAPPRVAPFELLAAKDRAQLPATVVDAYPLSAMQGGMLFHAELEAASSVYRVVTSLHIAIRYDEKLLRGAIADTVQRHPVLRTTFDLSNYSEPLQLVHAAAEVSLEVVDATCGQPAEMIDVVVQEWVEQAKHHHFDLSAAPLMAFTVHLRDAHSFQLSVVEHHVILDGWSDAAMLEEIANRYVAALDGQELWLPKIPSSYADFVAAERRAAADPAAEAFWTDALVGVEPTLLPRRSGATGTATARRHRHRAFAVPVDAGTLGKLQRLAYDQALPLKSLLVAAHVAVQGLVGDTDHVCSGLVVNGRLEQDGGDAVLGVFLNTLPFSVRTDGQTLLSLAASAFAFERDASLHRRFPFIEIQRLSDGLQLDSYVNFIDFHSLWKRRGENGALIRQGIGVAETNFALAANFLIDPVGGKLSAWLDCDLEQLEESFCHQLAGYYARALAALAEQAHTPLAQIDLVGPEETATLVEWNDTAVDYDRNATIHGLIEKQAEAAPDTFAVSHRYSQLTYRDLEIRANRLAQYLLASGVQPGGLVGISLYRGTDMVVAMLAVLKTGCAYVPLDPEYPRSRLAYIAENAQLSCLITEQAGPAAKLARHTVLVDRDAPHIEACPAVRPEVGVDGDAAAYVIYTSGSTGLPKGTRIRHRNVVNFLEGMDGRIGCGVGDVVLAVTSISFDISVLELLWPLARGGHVVVAGEKIVQNLVEEQRWAERALGFSLFFFSAGASKEQLKDGYRLVLEAAKAADELNLEAIWTPERHFHEFGGLYPNPSVMSAALSSITRRIHLRSGSVVAPLHDTLRLAEEWSLVDNLSGGRVGLAFASGWNANDFALAPHNYATRKQSMARQIDEFRRLWRGDAVERVNGNGEPVSLRIFPRPVQEQPPIWLTSAGAAQTFEHAGASGANLLTHLLGQDIEELARKIKAYREARRAAGFASPGQVTVMVHTYLDDDADAAREKAKGPFRQYLRTSTELWRQLFASMGVEYPEQITEEDIDSVLDLAVERYLDRSGLFGSPESVNSMLRSLSAVGADEIACLIDFGIPVDDALRGVTSLGRLKRLHEAEVADAEHSFAALCRRHRVTLVQGTPSLMAAVCAEPAALASMEHVRAILVGGEAFPSGVADRLLTSLPESRVFNMYGPTETTIWSTVHELDRIQAGAAHLIPIGRPIANTEILVLDARMRPVPIGVAGEIWIGGEGVAGHYLGQPELTAERFRAHPGGQGQVYRTGDRARWRPDGLLEFLGRVDRQVKILGHRIEPDEVESVLSRHPQVSAVAVIPREAANGRLELVAYVAARDPDTSGEAESTHIARWGDIWEGAYADPSSGVSDTPDSEFAGWTSSYTGEPMPAGEMREWLSHTVTKVLRLQPRALIDVGVGVGLLLRNIVPSVETYLGFDVSTTALAAARESLAHVHHDGCRVELRRGDATELARIAGGTANTVVINSVIQYFPGTGYLERVLREAARIVGNDGTVFVGDVRHLGLLEAFHASVQLARAGALTTLGELRESVRRQIAEENELCLTPEYFAGLASTLGPTGQACIELKRGHSLNELTAFRYDVTLPGQAVAQPARVGRSIAWGTEFDLADRSTPAKLENLAVLERFFGGTDDSAFTVTNIPNRRLVKPQALVRLLSELPAETTAWEVERRLWLVDDAHAVDPEELARLAEQLGWEVRLLVRAEGNMDVFDAHFSLPGDGPTSLLQAMTRNSEMMEQLS